MAAQGPGVDFTKALAGVTALAAGVTVLGKTSGTFDIMQRNHPTLSAVIFVGAVVAGVLVAAAGLMPNRTAWELVFFAVGLALFLFASIAAVVLLTIARGERPPPSVNVQLSAPTKAGAPSTVTGSVTAEQMTSGQSLRVSVLAQTASEAAAPTPPGQAAVEDRIYQARVGADASGNVKLPFSLPVPTRYEWLTVVAWIDEEPEYCLKAGPQGILGAAKKTPGCLVIRLPDAVTKG